MRASSYWVSFAKTLPMMLAFGIVGPVFLLAYFLIDQPDTEWLLWWGLVVTALDVAIAAAVAPAVARSHGRIPGRRHRPPIAPPEPEPAEPLAEPPSETPAGRLAELDELMKNDLLTTEEYEASRKRILDEL